MNIFVFQDTENTVFDGLVPIVELVGPSADEKEDQPSMPTGAASMASPPAAQKRMTPSISQPSSSKRRRTSIESYTNSKVDFNELRYRLLLENHEMEMKILQTNLKVAERNDALAEIEIEIKKVILAREKNKSI